MIARLVSQSKFSPQTFSLTHLPVLLGRAEEADVRVEDQWVSRRHCQLDQRDGVLMVRDLGSKHGTWVNHQRVDEAPILPGDELEIGITTLRADYKARKSS